MARRVAISPKVRWTVFARDGFRCRYCGAQPPDAILVVDHSHPVARGGLNNPDNLITACETCNAGKSDAEFPGLEAIATYFTLGDRVVGWLDEAFRQESGDTWSPDQDLLMECLLLSESYAFAEQIVREFAARIRTGEVDCGRYDFHKVMVLFQGYIEDVTRTGHPSLAEWTLEEIKERFWRDYPLWLE